MSQEYVYFIQERGGSHCIKIGTSTNPRSRLATLQTSRHITLEILHTVEGGRDLESSLHQRFKEFSIEGKAKEWFYPDVTLLLFIDELKNIEVSRKFKFKAYDKVRKELFEVYSIHFSQNPLCNSYRDEEGPSTYRINDRFFGGKDVLLFEHTGVFDKLGKGIYEGDFIYYSSRYPDAEASAGVYKVDYRSGGFWLRSILGLDADYPLCDLGRLSYSEIAKDVSYSLICLGHSSETQVEDLRAKTSQFGVVL